MAWQIRWSIVAVVFLHFGPHSPLWSVSTHAHRGTPTLDGVESPGEWSNAEVGTGQLTLPPGLGGATVAATVLAMNDDFHLYLAVRFPYASIPGGSARLRLGAFLWTDDSLAWCDPANPIDQAEIRATNGAGSFLDAHGLGCALGTVDTLADPPGTNDGAGHAVDAGDWIFLEGSHEFDSADDAYDISSVLGGHASAVFYVSGHDGGSGGTPLLLQRRIYLAAEGYIFYSGFEVGNLSEWDQDFPP